MESLGDNRKRAHFVGLFDSYLPLHALTETHLEGAGLFQNDCATCHAANGHTRSRWQVDFQRLPPDLFTGPYLHLPASDTAAQRGLRLACIVKFGIPGTDMPGHEYLPDTQVVSLSLWLSQITERPLAQSSVPTPPTHTGESQ